MALRTILLLAAVASDLRLEIDVDVVMLLCYAVVVVIVVALALGARLGVTQVDGCSNPNPNPSRSLAERAPLLATTHAPAGGELNADWRPQATSFGRSLSKASRASWLTSSK